MGVEVYRVLKRAGVNPPYFLVKGLILRGKYFIIKILVIYWGYKLMLGEKKLTKISIKLCPPQLGYSRV